MFIPKPSLVRARTLIAFAFLGSLTLLACSVNVKDHNAGEKNKVDIDTPIGGVHINEDVDVRETGMPVYPGARPKPKSGKDDTSANVNIASSFFGVKVAAIEYESDDSPNQVINYYRDQLKKYGNVVECHTNKQSGDLSVQAGDKEAHTPVDCEGTNSGNVVEIKAGTKDNQHLVSVEPQGKGASFSLVHIQTRGKEGSI